MRVSAGFLEIGLSGKIRMYSLPPRFTWREMAIRAASIWREVTNPHDRACSAYSPNATSVAPFERPVIRPFCCLRHFTFLGAAIVLVPYLPCLLLREPRVPLWQNLALEDPAFDADGAVGG